MFAWVMRADVNLPASTAADRLLDEGPEQLRDLVRRLKFPGSLHTARRWCIRGIQGHRLEHLRIGGRLYSTEPAMRRFLRRRQELENARQDAADSRAREIEVARADLQARGLL